MGKATYTINCGNRVKKTFTSEKCLRGWVKWAVDDGAINFEVWTLSYNRQGEGWTGSFVDAPNSKDLAQSCKCLRAMVKRLISQQQKGSE